MYGLKYDKWTSICHLLEQKIHKTLVNYPCQNVDKHNSLCFVNLHFLFIFHNLY